MKGLGNKFLVIGVLVAGIFGFWVLAGGIPIPGGEDEAKETLGSSGAFVRIETPRGDVRLELFPDAAPRTVENFLTLARAGFYDGTTFHRVIPGFVAQGGDPLSKDGDSSNDGRGGPGYTFEDEINPASIGVPAELIALYQRQGYRFSEALRSYPVDEGYLAMANSGPNTNGSQFFIVLEGQQRHLYGKHTVFGRVVSGMDVVRQVQQGDIMRVRVE